MKSLLFTGLLTMGFAHTGAFLEVWELPHVKDHVTIGDVGRKLKKVVKWKEQRDALRNARNKARDENYALYQAPRGPGAPLMNSTQAAGPFKPVRSRSTSRK
jgi:hypothetical protein